jgi:PncC family amidohydrolase
VAINQHDGRIMTDASGMAAASHAVGSCDENMDMQGRCDALAAVILARCKLLGAKIAAAESLTGGLLADAFVRVPGASAVFLGSAVTYDIAAKASMLGVDAELLRLEGAVHPEVARQMAQATADLYRQPGYDAVIGLSTTGVAGPGSRWRQACGTGLYRFGASGCILCFRTAADRCARAALSRLARGGASAERAACFGRPKRTHSEFTGIISFLSCCS